MPSKKASKTKSRSQTPNHKHSTANATPNKNSKNGNDPTQNLSPETKVAFENALEDVHTRFILNLPSEELASSNRLFFQIEQAWWFYEDFICDEMDATIDTNDNNITPMKKKNNHEINYPRFSNLKSFAKTLCKISPILSPTLLPSFDVFWKEFTNYKRKISTYGTILLNTTCDKIVLCQDYKSKCWTIPAGKVNQNEKGLDAAIRETYEETGFDIEMNFGLTKLLFYDNDNEDGSNTNDNHNENDSNNNNYNPPRKKCTWSKLSEDHSLTYVENDGSGKQRTSFICVGVPDDFEFNPVVRKEISDVKWHDLENLPKKTFAILPFMKDLRRWIRKNYSGSISTKDKNKKQRDESAKKQHKKEKQQQQQQQQSGSRSGSQARSRSVGSDRSLVTSEDDDLVQSGLTRIGEINRWSEEDMFRTNEALIGRKIEYDGNPQQFATKGFNGIDPHAFRIVGGEFMNSSARDIATAPDRSMLQPLFRPNDNDDYDGDDDDLKPFFADDGATPWGDMVLPGGGIGKNEEEEGRRKTVNKGKAPPTHKVRNSQQRPHSRSECSSDTFASESSIPSAADFEEYLLNDGSNPNDNVLNEDDDYVFVSSKASEHKKKSAGLAILAMLRGGDDVDGDKNDMKTERVIPASTDCVTDDDNNTHNESVDIFMTDKEITTKSQKQKKEALTVTRESREEIASKTSKGKATKAEDARLDQSVSNNENEHLKYLKQWVNDFPQAKPSKHFGDFRFDVEKIMSAVMKVK